MTPFVVMMFAGQLIRIRLLQFWGVIKRNAFMAALVLLWVYVIMALLFLVFIMPEAMIR